MLFGARSLWSCSFPGGPSRRGRAARSLLAAGGFVLAAAQVGGCGGSSAAPANSAESAQRDSIALAQRLAGTWHLVDYRPEVPLEPMFQMLLSSQIQTMTIRFDGGRLYADSAALHLQRTFVVSDVAGNVFKLRAVDENGVMLTSSCQLSDDGTRVVFHGETEPWRGTGTLRR